MSDCSRKSCRRYSSLKPGRLRLLRFVSTVAQARSDTMMLVGAHWVETECVQ